MFPVAEAAVGVGEQFEVRAVVFPRQGQHDEFARLTDALAARVPGRDVAIFVRIGRLADARFAKLVDQSLILRGNDLLKTHLGDVGEDGVRRLDLILAQDVPHRSGRCSISRLSNNSSIIPGLPVSISER